MLLALPDCPRTVYSMQTAEQGLCNGMVSICPVAAAEEQLDTVRSQANGLQYSAIGKYRQCHVYSQGMLLNTDFLFSCMLCDGKVYANNFGIMMAFECKNVLI